ncbi:hypothetical protein [Paracoccus saliphilus]|uniref:Uncharacterized protein n=1 Tax=Paracoccus saliphilus TaxID=405559 RepID=A0AA46A6H7_9RHOB|nr:hypothetical protein [Paracoccus saliphilus]WCR01632.1 hypothetical protein JHX88_11875 [Paracoccus saliphilus]SIS98547.1 hypothetical protein SAMN05421772_11140 [Paracoccus saliphilus]
MTFQNDASSVYVSGQPVSKGGVRALWGKIDGLEADVGSAIRDGAAIITVNIGGTGSAITADIAPVFVNAGITQISGGSTIEYIPLTTNDTANPTMTIAGTTFDIRGDDGGTWRAKAFVPGRSYLLRRRGGTLRVILGGATKAEIDQAGVIRLVNLTGTADNFTAELAPGLEGQTVGTGSTVRFVALGTNTQEGPSCTIGSISRQVRDTNHSPLPAEGLLEGRTYFAEIHSNTIMRIVYSAESMAERLARDARLDANDAKWTDRPVFIEAETPETYTVPASTRMIVTTTLTSDYMEMWRKSGDQGSPPAEGRVPTANDGYWIRIAKVAKESIIQSVLLAIQELQTGMSSSMQTVVQRRATIPDRPAGAAMVMWRTFDDPSAKMHAGVDLHAKVEPAPILSFADSFNRADEPLATNDDLWVNVRTQGALMTIVNNAAQPSASNALPVVQSKQFLPPDQFIEANVLGGSSSLSSGKGTFLYINMPPETHAGYRLNLRSSQLVLEEVDEALNTVTLAATSSGFLTYPVTARLERDGKMLRAYIDGVEALTAEASTYDGGMIGIGANAASGDISGCRIDNVMGGVLD